jgi:hypothetical protein
MINGRSACGVIRRRLQTSEGDRLSVLAFHLRNGLRLRLRIAEVCGKAGQPEEGLKRLAEAAELVETTQELAATSCANATSCQRACTASK